MSTEKNPNGKFFTIRRTFAILKTVMFVFNLFFVNLVFVIALVKTSFDSNIVLYFVVYNAFFCGLCALYIITYSLIVFFHDIGFEKIAKIGKYVMDFKK